MQWTRDTSWHFSSGRKFVLAKTVGSEKILQLIHDWSDRSTVYYTYYICINIHINIYIYVYNILIDSCVCNNWVHVDCICIRAPVNVSNIAKQYSQRRLQSPKPLTTSLTTLTSNANDWHQKVKTHDGKHPSKYVNGCKSLYISKSFIYL